MPTDIKVLNPIVNKLTMDQLRELKKTANYKPSEETYEITDLVEGYDSHDTRLDNIDGEDGSIAQINENLANANEQISGMINGNVIVEKAHIANNLVNAIQKLVTQPFSSRITATNNNEIVSAVKDETTSKILSIGGQTNKQVLQNSESEVLTTKTPIKSVEGWSLKQIGKNGNFVNTSIWQRNGVTTTVANNEVTITPQTLAPSRGIYQLIPTVQNQKYLVTVEGYFKYNNNVQIGLTTTTTIVPSAVNTWVKLSVIVTASSTGDTAFVFYQDMSTNYVLTDTIKLRNAMIIPLNESSESTLTIEQFNAKFPNLPYFEGILNAIPQSIISKSNNLFDKSKVVNGSYYSSSGTLVAEATSQYYNQDITVEIGKTYYFNKAVMVNQWDVNNAHISRTAEITSYTPTSNVKYFRVSNYTRGLTYFDGFMINTVSASLPYQVYAQHTIPLSTPFTYGMPKLPNGVGDKWLPSGYVQNIKQKILQDNDVYTMYTSLVNVDCVRILKPNDSKMFNNATTKESYIDGLTEIQIPTATGLMDNISYINQYNTFNNSGDIFVVVAKGTTLAQAKTLLVGKALYYQLATPVVDTTKTYSAFIDTYTNSTITVDNGLLTMGKLDSYTCQLNNDYYVSCNVTDKTNLKVTNGLGQDYAMTNGYVKFKCTVAGEYYISYNQDGVNKTSKRQWFALTDMNLTTKSQEECRVMYGDKFYPFGFTNSKTKYIASCGDNLFDSEYFYETLKAVNSANIVKETKDGRNCIKISNSSVYANIQLYKGKFSPSVQYKFRVELFISGSARGIVVTIKYTDGTSQDAFSSFSFNTFNAWAINEFTSASGKTIDYLYITTASANTTWANIDKFQIQTIDNITTEYLPYKEDVIAIPQVWINKTNASDIKVAIENPNVAVYDLYDKKSLPNGVKDELLLENGVFKKPLGSVKFNGTENWVLSQTNTNTIRVSLTSTDLNGITALLSNSKAVCNLFNLVESTNALETEGFNIFNGTLYISILKLRLPSQDIAGFKSWLASNNAIVYFETLLPILVSFAQTDNNIVAWNYGREEILDEYGNSDIANTQFSYYTDIVPQVETNTTNIADMLLRIQALEDLHGI